MSKLFNGEVALVTGGSSGIGRAAALAFATQGARVVADAVVWLCSKGASFVTGHTLPVDGGYLIP